MKQAKRILVVLLVALTLGVQFSALLPQTVSALEDNYNEGSGSTPYITAAAEDQAISYLYFSAIAKCYSEAGGTTSNDYIDSGKAAKWDFFNGEGTYPGPMLDNDGKDGKTDCQDLDLEAAFGLWGVTSPEEALCNTGWIREAGTDDQSVADCIAGSSDFERPDRGKALNAFIHFVNGRYYGLDSYDIFTINDLKGAAKYYLYSESFRQGCEANESAENNSLSDDEIRDSSDLFRLMTVSGDEIVAVTFKGSDRDHEITYRTTDQQNEKKDSCAYLVDEANKNIDAWLTYTNDPDRPGQSGGGPIDNNSPNSPDPCNATANPLTWVMCPIIDAINTAVKGMEKLIFDRLEVDVTRIFNTNKETGQAYYAAWNAFRTFAVIVIVIGALIMVISQALGYQLFDAYTVKKVLPRLVVAAIMISLSWFIMKFLVNLTNDLGLTIRSMIYYPFQNIGDGTQSLGSSIMSIVAGTTTYAFLGVGGVLSLMATAGLAVLIAFLVVVIREIVIVTLIIMAPLAIACFVLPNTQKVYDLWWDSFWKGLLMFPIISGFIAVGHVFSQVASSMGGSINQIVAIIAYFIPYFLLPFTFRLAGGALATIGGLTNDRGRGVFDRLRNYRGEKSAYNFKRMQNNQRWDPNSRIGKRANTAAGWLTDPTSNLAYKARNIPGFRRSGHGVASAIDGMKVEQTGKLFEELNKMYGSNDKVYRMFAGQYGGLGAETQAKLRPHFWDEKNETWRAPATLNDLQELTSILGSSDSATERSAGLAISGSMGRLGSLYKDAEMGKANIQGAGILGLAAHGFANGDDISGTYNSLVASGNSEGFANAISQQSQVYVSKSRPDAKAGYGTTVETDASGKRVQISGLKQMGSDGHIITYKTVDANGNTVLNDDALGLRGFDMLQAIGPGDIAASKGGFLKDLDDKGKGGAGSHIKYVLKHGDTDRAKRAFEEVGAIRREANAGSAIAQERLKKLSKSAKGREQLRLEQAVKLYTPIRDEVLQSASYYSHASSDVKASAMQILEDTSHGTLLAQYDAQRSTHENPEAHNPVGGPEPGGNDIPSMGPPS